MPFMGILLLAYAASMAVATFIENDYGAPVARFMVYNAWWFELLQFLLVINMIGNVFTYKLYEKAKFSILLFHLAFIIILVGAGITRYFSYEGTMHIRENETQNKFTSEKNYLQVWKVAKTEELIYEKPLFVSPYLKNQFQQSIDFDGKNIKLELKKLVLNPSTSLKVTPTGSPMVELLFATSQGIDNFFLREGEVFAMNSAHFTLNTNSPKNIQLFLKNSKLFIQSPSELKLFDEKGEIDTIFPANTRQEINTKSILETNKTKFGIKAFASKAKIRFKKGSLTEGLTSLALVFNLSEGENTDEAGMLEVAGTSQFEYVKLGDQKFKIAYGPKEIELPFELKLRDFQLDRYPGSHSPSSYASEVTLIDKEENIEKEYRIFMNNILSHRGFRFYQSSYDTDEKGTILSVNRDGLGTFVTYLGYFLLFLGMVWSLINKNSYLAELSRRTSGIREKRSKVAVLLLLLLGLNAQNLFAQEPKKMEYSQEHAKLFGKLLVQDPNGRIKPMQTMSNEVLRKVSRAEEWDGFNSNQVFLGLLFNSNYWKTVNMIKVANPDLMKKLGKEGDYVCYNDLINEAEGTYILGQESEMAFAKPESEQNKYEKELIALDERVNIMYQIVTWQYLRVFPNPEQVDKSWLTPFDAGKIQDNKTHEFAKTAFSRYYTEITKAWTDGNWKDADEVLKSIQDYQKKYAAEIIPSESKLELEIHYLKMNIFKRLFRYYGMIGFIFLIILFVGIFKPAMKLKKTTLVFSVILAILFFFHTYGLGLRWYISGHAPFSNGYESMIYIAWAIMLAGFVFMKKSPITLSATAILASITLMVANLSWMNPEITPLVPVLKSYWLTIHVSIITASYGFLALGAIMGFLSLILIIFANAKHKEQFNLTITELTNVNHMTLIIGVYMLTIGTFLGGIWANESWGRYWGWDPKETWALISVIIYTFVLHTRFIPFLNNKYFFNLLSLLSFASILMTYFGVNFYLSGLHSYAQGDPIPVPEWVYYSVASVFVIAIIAYIRSRKLLITEEVKS